MIEYHDIKQAITSTTRAKNPLLAHNFLYIQNDKEMQSFIVAGLFSAHIPYVL
jgi:hypothetical protein